MGSILHNSFGFSIKKRLNSIRVINLFHLTSLKTINTNLKYGRLNKFCRRDFRGESVPLKVVFFGFDKVRWRFKVYKYKVRGRVLFVTLTVCLFSQLYFPFV
ncbi:uncharacterized protein LOC110230164, partial [Arabidopsis lyrata subsp. lyrata]|uniref:uncharacterized protein LOC110230164 n=1 Tax=Arabidopsis lyrata subsp. lyrata TaxID=81972 RepID=UPI000A29E62A